MVCVYLLNIYLLIGLLINVNGIIISENVKNENLKNYPVWKIKQNNQIDFEPIPIFLVYPSNFEASDNNRVQTVKNNDDHNLIDENQNVSNSNSSTDNLINELGRLLNIDPAMLPSIDMAMGLLGTTNEAETVEAIREIASTPEGIELIRSFIGPETSNSEHVETSRSEAAAIEKSTYVPPPSYSLNEISPILDNRHTDFQILRNVVGPYFNEPTKSPPSIFTRFRQLFSFPSFGQVQTTPPPPQGNQVSKKYFIIPQPRFKSVPQIRSSEPSILSHDDQIQFRPSMKQYTIMAPDVKKRPQKLLYLKNTNRPKEYEMPKYGAETKPVRNSAHNFYATGKIHRAKPDAIKLLPITLHQQSLAASKKSSESQTNANHDEAMINRINELTKDGLKES